MKRLTLSKAQNFASRSRCIHDRAGTRKHLDAFTTGTRKYGKPWKQLDPAILADGVLWLEFGHYIVNRTDLKVSATRGRSKSVVSEHRELFVSGYCE